MKRIIERQSETNKGDATEERQERIQVGMRCRLSAIGVKNMPRQIQHHCTVIGVGRTKNQLRVRFDGYKSATTLHRSYLEAMSQCACIPEKKSEL
jgi:hypothetical protein